MAMMRIFLLVAALSGANVALAETAVKGRPALVLDGAAARVENPSDYAGPEQVALLNGQLIVRPRGVPGDRAKALEAAAGAVERTSADLVMEVDALFIE